MPKEITPSASVVTGTNIHTVRGQAVMLDSDLAEVYGVETKRINEAVKRNPKRFEQPYSFQLLQDEWDILRSQIATSSLGHGGRRYPPRVFTEHGAVMLATVLNSDQAIQASRAVVDAFVRLRHVLDANRELSRRIDELNVKFEKKSGEDSMRFHAIFQELKRLTLGIGAEDTTSKARIGFKTNKERGISGKGK